MRKPAFFLPLHSPSIYHKGYKYQVIDMFLCCEGCVSGSFRYIVSVNTGSRAKYITA